MILISLIAAVIPMLFYLILLWKFDKYEPEPLQFVIFHFLWGASIAVALGFIGGKVMSFPLEILVQEPEKASFIQIILIAPIVEELSKGLLLFWTVNNKRFDNLTDGLVYGGAIGLGFGMTENFLYFITFGDTITSLIWLIIVRSGFSAVMHSMSTAAFGALLSASKYSKKRNKKLLVIAGFVIAISIHFIWNLSVSFAETFLFGMLFIVVIVGIFIAVFIFALRFEKQIIKKKLNDEIPEEYIRILLSSLRNSKGWFIEKYRKEFIDSSIRLAFRKHEFEISPKKEEHYIDDIHKLRITIQELLVLNNNKGNDI